MHVVLLSGTAQSAHNGSSRVERALARALAEDGVEVTLLSRDEVPHEGAPFRHLLYARPSSKDWKTWLLAGRVADRLRAIHSDRPIDLVHAFGLFPVCLYAARFAPAPFVLTPHSMDVDPPRGLARPVAAAVRRAAALTFLNRAQLEKTALSYGLDRTRCQVIPNGVEAIAPPAPPPPQTLPDRFVLFAGRLEAEKGVRLFLDALGGGASDRGPRRRRPR